MVKTAIVQVTEHLYIVMDDRILKVYLDKDINVLVSDLLKAK